jgi:hypothetical protein
MTEAAFDRLGSVVGASALTRRTELPVHGHTGGGTTSEGEP